MEGGTKEFIWMPALWVPYAIIAGKHCWMTIFRASISFCRDVSDSVSSHSFMTVPCPTYIVLILISPYVLRL